MIRLFACLFLFFALGAPYANAKEDWVQKSIRAFLGEKSQIVSPPQAIEVAFSPNGGATDLVLKAISSARTSIHVAAYSFTSRPIATALIEAKKAGIEVAAVVDHGQIGKNSHSVLPMLEKGGVSIRIDTKHRLQHNKYIIVDAKTVETGSFNYTAAAEQANSENVVVLWNAPELASAYLKNWQALWDAAEPYNRVF